MENAQAASSPQRQRGKEGWFCVPAGAFWGEPMERTCEKQRIKDGSRGEIVCQPSGPPGPLPDTDKQPQHFLGVLQGVCQGHTRSPDQMALSVSAPPPIQSQEMRLPCSSPWGPGGHILLLFHRQPCKYSKQHCFGFLPLPGEHPNLPGLKQLTFSHNGWASLPLPVPGATAGATPAPAPGGGLAGSGTPQMASATSLTVGASRWLR